MTETLRIPTRSSDPADPFHLPASVRTHRFSEATAGGQPRLETRFALWRDDAHLRILFRASDEERVQATLHRRDDPLYNEDVVEAFISLGDPARYIEIEVSPAGSIFDAWVHSPDGVRATMDVDSDWNCEGLFAATRRTKRTAGSWLWETAVGIPFASIGADPQPGEVWTGNFYRIDRGIDGQVEYSAWRPTMKQPADFHVVSAFGRLRFSD